MKTPAHHPGSQEIPDDTQDGVPGVNELAAEKMETKYWRSLQEIETGGSSTSVPEFSSGAQDWWDGVSRRNFLKMAAASVALGGLSACTRQPLQQILPYVKQPPEWTPGEPLFYATCMTLGGYALGILVKNREGHPIKIDGNPEHPATLGGSNIWMQAAVLDLYDPDRSQSYLHKGEPTSWERVLATVAALAGDMRSNHGEGLRILTETVTSPTLTAQIGEILKTYPGARWHQYESVNRDNVLEGTKLAFGGPLDVHYDFEKAKTILSLDGDFLYAHPAALRYARQFSKTRRAVEGTRELSRLFVAESSPSLTGSVADHRLRIKSGKIERWLENLAVEFGYGANRKSSSDRADTFFTTAVAELKRTSGASAIVVGENQPARVHSIAAWLNEALGNVGRTVWFSESAQSDTRNQIESLRVLVEDMKEGKVTTLIIAGGNPVYGAPTDFNFAAALGSVRQVIHCGLHVDETASQSGWHIPAAHFLESWGDARAHDGTVTIQQPLIAPMYGGKTMHEIFAVLLHPEVPKSDYEVVREYWRESGGWTDFERKWRRALHDGLVAGTAALPKTVKTKPVEPLTVDEAEKTESLELTVRPDPSIWDGRFANNGWLQECPRPLSKLTWDNAALISPLTARRHELKNGDVVEVTAKTTTLRVPVWIQPGQADNSILLHLGAGRERSGRVGTGIGFNAGQVRHSENFWHIDSVALHKTGHRHELVTTQTHHQLGSPERQIYREATLRQFLQKPNSIRESVEVPAVNQTLYNPEEYGWPGYKWGMSIDLGTCIGCNACLVACEAENNIPVVGKDEVKRNREMFWIRVDTYFSGEPEDPEFNHMPVACMQCEHAPCELVCPVEATVHDHEGLNLQVYNRCVGTRFCSNNCPYKVRRFNFYQYADYKTPSKWAMQNPEVTVRWRGVMEKCTYCVQRISRGRIDAEKENRPIKDGEVRTACQQACPAEAIVFGNLNDQSSEVAKRKKSPLDYSMLGKLNTRPRTTYLARIRNPVESATNPA